MVNFNWMPIYHIDKFDLIDDSNFKNGVYGDGKFYVYDKSSECDFNLDKPENGFSRLSYNLIVIGEISGLHFIDRNVLRGDIKIFNIDNFKDVELSYHKLAGNIIPIYQQAVPDLEYDCRLSKTKILGFMIDKTIIN